MIKQCIQMILIICSLTLVVQAEDDIIFLKSSVEVTGMDVYFGDLIDQSNMVISHEWRNRRIMMAPQAGKTSYHALTDVAYALSRFEDMKHVILRGEPVVSIYRKDRRVEKDELHEPMLEHLRNTDPWKGNKITVKVLNIPRDKRIPVGKTEYRVTRVDQKTSRGYSMAYVTIYVDGLEELEMPVGIEIQFLSEVWVAASSLESGQSLSVTDLRQEVRVLDSTSNFISASTDLTGYEITRSLTPGTELRWNAVSKPMCAKRGSWVAINAYGEHIHVTMRGRAMTNGRLGDRIMCLNERSQRQVMVELTGNGNAVLVRL